MSTRRHALLVSLLAFTFCVPLPTLAEEQTAPQPVGRLYTPGPFDSLSVNGSAEVQLRQGPRDEVFVEGDDEVQRELSLQLKDGRLSLRSSGSWMFWRFSKRLRVQVMARDLKRLSVSGAANVRAPEPLQLGRLDVNISGSALVQLDQLRADELRFDVSGSGDGVFAGQVGLLAVQISGRGDVQAEGLQTQQARIAISGMGKSKVWVQQELSVGISGIGTADYWGSPQVHRRLSGIGTLNPRGTKAGVTPTPSPAEPVAAPPTAAAPAGPA